MSVDLSSPRRMTNKTGMVGCDLVLELPAGTTRAALKLGMPKPEKLTPAHVKAWLAQHRAAWPEPFHRHVDAHGVSWGFVKPAEIARYVPLKRTKKAGKYGVVVVDLCENCLGAWAPSPRWKKVGPHFRVRAIETAKGMTVEIMCGACLMRVNRVRFYQFLGLVQLHGDVPTTSREQLAAVEAKAEAAAPSYTFSQAVAGRPSPAPAAC